MVANIFLELAFVWRIPPVSYTTPCFMNAKEEEEEVPSHIHFETSLRSLSSRKRKRKGIVFASSFVKKNQGTNCHFPLFSVQEMLVKVFPLFLVGSPFPPKKEEEGVFIALLSLSPSLFLFFFREMSF